jgi:branched-chain amino acid transport system permease protein
MQEFIQLVVIGLIVGSFYSLIALGYTMVYGIVRLINFAHGNLVILAAFAGWATLRISWIQALPAVPQVLVAGVVAIVVSVLVAVLVARLIFWRLIDRAPLGFMIVSLSIGVVIEQSIELVFGARIHSYPEYAISSNTYRVAGVQLTGMDIAVVVCALLLMLGMLYFANGTRTGRAMRALAVDHDAARLMGINVGSLILLAFAIGAALAAISGVMLGVYYGRVTYDMGLTLGLKAFAAAVIGGIGNIGGAMVGGLVIGVVESLVGGYVTGDWGNVFIFGTLIVMLYLRPSGLLGERVAERV